jgi:hypothetical protein
MNRPVLGPIDRQARTCQAIWVCVRFIMLKGDSYRVKDRVLAKAMMATAADQDDGVGHNWTAGKGSPTVDNTISQINQYLSCAQALS